MKSRMVVEKVAEKAAKAMGMSFMGLGSMRHADLVVAVTSGLRVGRRARLVDEQIMTVQEGTSNKFHYFAMFDDPENERWVAGNAYGRIGYTPTVVQIAEGNRSWVQSEYQRKIRSKLMKYEPASIGDLRR